MLKWEKMSDLNEDTLNRIAQALEKLAPKEAVIPTLDGADAFVWHAEPDQLLAINNVNHVKLDLLKGIE